MRHLAFSLALFANAVYAQECDCIWRGSFTDVAKKTDLVIAGEIISRSGNSADIKIEKIFHGKHFQDSTRIWGATTLRDGTQLCRAKLEEFPPGTRWVMALEKISEIPPNGFNPQTPNLGFGRKDDYALSACGAYWLVADGETARGNIVNGERWSYDNDHTMPLSFAELQAFLDGNISTTQLNKLIQQPKELRQLMQRSQQQLLKSDIESAKKVQP